MNMLEAEYDCACPGPPPQFRLPPPPLPPLLHDSACSDPAALSAMYSCDVMPVLDAELQGGPSLPGTALIAVSSVLLLATVLAAAVLLCRYRRKVPNLVTSCKASPQNRVCDVSAGNDVIYEDITNVGATNCPPHPHTLQLRDMREVPPTPVCYPGGPASVFVCPDHYANEDACTPVYQEIGQGRCESDPDSEAGVGPGAGSEDEFAEDELSLEEVSHGPSSQPRTTVPPAWLDSLLRYHPNIQPPPPPAPAPVTPYETVPVPGFSSFRHPVCKVPISHDSDSGYSHNTSSGRQNLSLGHHRHRIGDPRSGIS